MEPIPVKKSLSSRCPGCGMKVKLEYKVTPNPLINAGELIDDEGRKNFSVIQSYHFEFIGLFPHQDCIKLVAIQKNEGHSTKEWL